MNKVFKKSGRKFVKKISLFSKRVNRDSREHIRENLIGHISHIRDVRLYVVEWILMVVIITLLSITQAYWYVNSFAVETYTNGGTYTEATLGKISSFNPLFASTSSEETLSRLLFATLPKLSMLMKLVMFGRLSSERGLNGRMANQSRIRMCFIR